MNRLARWFVSRPLVALGVLAVGSVALARPAQAWWNGGVVVGVVPPPLYFGPPVYYPPPLVYAPPPVVYAPPSTYIPPSAGGGRSCYAGAYVCPLAPSIPAGGSCSCPAGAGHRVLGRAG